MFDIKLTINNGDSTILVGHYDDFEHELYKVLRNLFDDNKEKPNKGNSINWASLTAVVSDNKFLLSNTFFVHLIHNNIWKNLFHLSLHTPPLYAPPDAFIY